MKDEPVGWQIPSWTEIVKAMGETAFEVSMVMTLFFSLQAIRLNCAGETARFLSSRVDMASNKPGGATNCIVFFPKLALARTPAGPSKLKRVLFMEIKILFDSATA